RHRCRDLDAAITRYSDCRDARANALGNIGGQLATAVGEYQRELLATIAADVICFAQHPRYLLRHRVQDTIADLVSVVIVDALEMIQISEHDGEWFALTYGARDLAVDRQMKRAPIADSSQHVDHAESVQVLLIRTVLQTHRHHRRQVINKIRGFVAAEALRSVGTKMQAADQGTVSHQWQQCNGAHRTPGK